MPASRPTLQDIAVRAGVSKATVSFALNNKGVIGDDTRQRVLAAASELGYPLPFLSGSPLVVGVAYLATLELERAQVISSFARGIQTAAQKINGCSTMFVPAEERGWAWRNLLEAGVNGLIFLGIDADHVSVRNAVSAGIPVVLVNHLGGNDVSSVCVANQQGMEMATTHLIQKHGCRRFVFTQSASPPSFSNARLAGCRKALANAGYADGGLHVIQYKDRIGEVCEQLDCIKTQVDAIVCDRSNDAAALLRLLSQRGWSIPGEVKIVGFDNTRAAADCALPITVVAYDPHSVGGEALALLMRLIKGELNQAHLQLPCHMILRASCGC